MSQHDSVFASTVKQRSLLLDFRLVMVNKNIHVTNAYKGIQNSKGIPFYNQDFTENGYLAAIR